MNTSFRQAQVTGPFRDGFRDPVVGQPMRSARVSRLLKFVLPSAILWAVWSVVVYAAQGVSGTGLETDIIQEIDEPVFSAPSVTNVDSALGVVGPVNSLGVVTPVLHSNPSSKFGRISALRGVPVLEPTARQILLVEAGTRLRPSCGEFSGANHRLISAVAFAEPVDATSAWVFLDVVNANGDKSSKSFPCVVLHFHAVSSLSRCDVVAGSQPTAKVDFRVCTPYPAPEIVPVAA